MKEELELVAKFHKKFQVPVESEPVIPNKDRIDLRHRLMKEELEEYKAGAENGDLENVAKELADILFATYGTILEHGLQGKIEEIFAEVCKSNMSKDYHEFKMIKGKNYKPAEIGRVLGEKK
ncbi:MAG: nucleoside triphosphate pyrophosphohydrolase family protein [Candidatus Nomurabacteria bacterium]|nr:nucleoside triphosphate pyrophosphohydrolase family protein [Candidatus Nomurabacteria bacterium]USN87344.1 MAG: nucleoside triphosphate pyrophosphohydrolase family protein [Candidatus Nomurabacteria bacterium]